MLDEGGGPVRTAANRDEPEWATYWGGIHFEATRQCPGGRVSTQSFRLCLGVCVIVRLSSRVFGFPLCLCVCALVRLSSRVCVLFVRMFGSVVSVSACGRGANARPRQLDTIIKLCCFGFCVCMFLTLLTPPPAHIATKYLVAASRTRSLEGTKLPFR